MEYENYVKYLSEGGWIDCSGCSKKIDPEDNWEWVSWKIYCSNCYELEVRVNGQ